MGAIRQPHYRIVVADARSPRDGRFIEILGNYNPLTNPATINIDIAKYEEWKRKGAQPTDAVESLVRQYNRAQRRGAGAAQPASLQTRTASLKGMTRAEPTAVEEDVPAAEPGAVEGAGAPMTEAMAEATRDEGAGAEAMTQPAAAGEGREEVAG